jgi:hypothetical protein
VDYAALLSTLLAVLAQHAQPAALEGEPRAAPLYATLYAYMRSRVPRRPRAAIAGPVSRAASRAGGRGLAASVPASGPAEPTPLFQLDAARGLLEPWMPAEDVLAKAPVSAATMSALTDRRARLEREAEQQEDARVAVAAERAVAGVIRDVLAGVADTEAPVGVRARLLCFQELLGACVDDGLGDTGLEVIGALAGAVVAEVRLQARGPALADDAPRYVLCYCVVSTCCIAATLTSTSPTDPPATRAPTPPSPCSCRHTSAAADRPPPRPTRTSHLARWCPPPPRPGPSSARRWATRAQRRLLMRRQRGCCRRPSASTRCTSGASPSGCPSPCG